MSGYRAGKPEWLDPGFYPVDERLGEGMRHGADEVLLVDVGGGLGHDLQMLRRKYPRLRGRLVLQDKEEVVGQAGKEAEGWEGMGYDFFTEQPVKGAVPDFLPLLPRMPLNSSLPREACAPRVDVFC